MSSTDYRKLFVGGISLFTTLSSMRAFFGNFGDIEDATIITDRSTGISRGFGFVIFRHTDAAAAVMACSTSLRLEGHAIETKFALSKDRMENRIFVGGLPPDLRSESLHAFFSQYGVVQEAVIATDPATGRTRGFGFVMLEPDEAVEYVCRLRTIPAWDRQIECKRALSKSTLARQSAQQQQQAHMPMHSYPNQSNLAHSHAKPLSMPHAMPPAVAPVPYGHPAGHLSMSNPHVGVQPMGSMMGQPISAFPTMTTPVPMPVPAVSIVPFGARPPMPTAPLSAPLMAPEHVQALQEQQRKQEQKIQELEARLNQFRVSAQQPQPSGFVPVATSTYPIPAASNGAASGPAASWHAHGSNASVPSSSRAVSAIAAALQVATSSRHTAPSVASMSQHNANADGTHNSPGNPSNQHSDDGFDSKRDQRDHESPSGSSGSSQAAITPPSSGSIGADPFPHDTYTKMSQSFGPSMGFRRLQNSGPLVPAPFDPAKQSPINVSPHMQNMVLSYIPISPQVSHVFIAPPQVPLSYSASPLFRGRYVSSPLQTMVAAPLAQDPIMRQNTFPFQPIAPFVQTVGRRSLSSQ